MDRPIASCAPIIASVIATEFATVLGDASGPAVSTTEHVLSALRGLGVDNAVVEIDGPEVPIMDGSAAPFVAAIDQVGIATLSAPRRYIQVLKTVRVGKNGSYGELRPYLRGFRVEFEIDFDHPLIGRQSFAVDIEPDMFRRELARARTFGFMRDVAKLWSAGYALGASFENTVVVAENRVLNRRACGSPTSSCGTRCSMRSATLRWPARRCSGPIARCAAATSSIMPCSRR